MAGGVADVRADGQSQQSRGPSVSISDVLVLPGCKPSCPGRGLDLALTQAKLTSNRNTMVFNFGVRKACKPLSHAQADSAVASTPSLQVPEFSVAALCSIVL